MAADIPTYEPREFAIGETLAWSRYFADYLPADGWTLTYYFRGPTKFDAVASADEDDPDAHRITIAAAASANCLVGTYHWQAWASNLAGEKHRLASGTTLAVAGLATIDANYDGRSGAKKILVAIDALMAGKATTDQQEYSIGAMGSQRI